MNDDNYYHTDAATTVVDDYAWRGHRMHVYIVFIVKIK